MSLHFAVINFAFGIFFNHHPPPENVVYDMRKCHIKKNLYTLFDTLFKGVQSTHSARIYVNALTHKSTHYVLICTLKKIAKCSGGCTTTRFLLLQTYEMIPYRQHELVNIALR